MYYSIAKHKKDGSILLLHKNQTEFRFLQYVFRGFNLFDSYWTDDFEEINNIMNYLKRTTKDDVSIINYDDDEYDCIMFINHHAVLRDDILQSLLLNPIKSVKLIKTLSQ